MARQAWALMKTAVFTVVVPGTVAVYVPNALTRGANWTEPTGWVGYTGAVLLLCGIALYLRCAWDFAVRGLGTPAPIDPPRTLVVRGPYRMTRNPMYVAVLAVLIGEALIARSTALAAYAAIVFVGFFLFVLLYEEPVLRSKFGASYDDYRAAVPRWIGWPSARQSEYTPRP